MWYQPDRKRAWRAWLVSTAERQAWRLYRAQLDYRSIDADRDAETPGLGFEHADPRSDRSDHVEALEALHVLAAAPEGRRRAMELHVAGLTYDEIAAELGIGKARVNHLITEANTAIREERARLTARSCRAYGAPRDCSSSSTTRRGGSSAPSGGSVRATTSTRGSHGGEPHSRSTTTAEPTAGTYVGAAWQPADRRRGCALVRPCGACNGSGAPAPRLRPRRTRWRRGAGFGAAVRSAARRGVAQPPRSEAAVRYRRRTSIRLLGVGAARVRQEGQPPHAMVARGLDPSRRSLAAERTHAVLARAGGAALLLGVVVGTSRWVADGSLAGDGAAGIITTLYFLLGGVLYSVLGWSGRVTAMRSAPAI
jgi:hypothetical protein